MKRYRPFIEEERPFNMASALLKRCDLLFLKANETSVVGDYIIWFKVLKALKRTISFKLSDDEIKELEISLGEISNSLSMKAELKLDEKLDQLETKIISLMFKYGLYYPKYEKKKWEDEAIEEDT